MPKQLSAVGHQLSPLRLLVNPAAGRGRSVRRFEGLARRLEAGKVDFD